jgi:hypothetical protein
LPDQACPCEDRDRVIQKRKKRLNFIVENTFLIVYLNVIQQKIADITILPEPEKVILYFLSGSD